MMKKMIRSVFVVIAGVIVIYILNGYMLNRPDGNMNHGEAAVYTEKDTVYGMTGTAYVMDSQNDGGSGNTEILPSKYQSAKGYQWDDLYVILMLLTQTSPVLEGNIPVFSLVSIKDEWDPLLMIGYKNPDSSTGYYKMYVTDGDNIYELLELKENIYWDSEKCAFYSPEENAWLEYSPHVFLKEKGTGMPEGAKPLQQFSLSENSVTSETIRCFLQDLGN